MINLRKLYSPVKDEKYLTKGDQVIANTLPSGMTVGKVEAMLVGAKETEDVLVLTVDTGNLKDQDAIKEIAAVYNNKIPKHSFLPATSISKLTLLENYHGDQKTKNTD